MDKTTVHRNVPPQLRELYMEGKCSIGAVAKTREVNRYYVWHLIRLGEEPTDKTKKGRAARVALFLPERRHRKTPEIPEYVREWRRLTKDERHEVMKTYIDWKKSHEQ